MPTIAKDSSSSVNYSAIELPSIWAQVLTPVDSGCVHDANIVFYVAAFITSGDEKAIAGSASDISFSILIFFSIYLYF